MDDLTTLRIDEYYPHPPAKVWRALTDPELVGQWMMPGDFRLEAGHVYTMRGVAMPVTGFSGVVEAEVLAFEIGKSLTLRWRDANRASGGNATADFTITWTLEPEGPGTRLHLLHEGFDPADEAQRKARTIMANGWRTAVLTALRTQLDTAFD
jgi:uncharacterized protein YndB with AHSA1/START domain